MKWIFALWLAGLCSLTTGCHLAVIGARDVLADMRRNVEEWQEQKRNQQLAEAAWTEALCTKGDVSPDYARGFKDGFADYLEAGGTGEPPPLPPKRYRTIRYQTPQGYAAIEDWYLGFGYGATAARASDHRKRIVLPGPPAYSIGHPNADLGFLPISSTPLEDPLPGFQKGVED